MQFNCATFIYGVFMSFPKDLPPPDDFPPPPPPPTEEVKSKRGSSTSRPKQPLQSQAESKSTQHLSRKTPPPRPTAPKPVSEKVRAEAEKTAEKAEQLNKEPVEPKKMPELKKREGSGPKLPVALTPITIPKKPPIKPLFGPPPSRPDSKSSSNRGTPEPASSEPSASRKSTDDTVPPEPRLRKGSRSSEEVDWERRSLDKRDLIAKSEFSGTSIGDLQREEIETLKNVEAKETEALNAKNEQIRQIGRIIQETLETERSFFQSTKDLRGFFSKLKVLFAAEHAEFLSENLKKTKPVYFEEIAANWGKLRESSRILIEKLEQLSGGARTTQADIIQGYLLIFSKPEIQEHLELLKTLAGSYDYLRKLIDDKFKIEPDRDSTKLINAFESRTPGRVVMIASLLIMPAQRPPRYKLLMEQLLKRTSNIPEYASLVPLVKARINYLEGVIEDINNSMPKK